MELSFIDQEENSDQRSFSRKVTDKFYHPLPLIFTYSLMVCIQWSGISCALHLTIINATMAPPIYVKGGVWTNAEDQILRAAVSKYGLTQWARVASLLPKKTAKQAKARWNEYLNPQIDRSDWSKEDDEKLLNLAKLLPNQWRSIAPIMGRTATQCVERYQKLLEDAVKGDVSDESDGEELKLSGPGIETLPALGNAFESLPSRPDMEDMDDDEREMLSEATARLANTHGKKAKRKERERMLDESKRISLLQKRRELKAAGIKVSLELKNKKKRKEFDYNADIPHEHAPPPGLFDTSEEQLISEDKKLLFQKQVNLKGMDMIDVEKSNKRKNEEIAKRESRKLLKEIKSAAQSFADLAEQESKRRKLNLPAPGELDSKDDIDTRIKLRSQSILALQARERRGSEPYFPENLESHPDQLQTRVVLKKAMVDFIQTSLAGLPKTTKKVELVLPQLDSHEEMVTMEIEDSSPQNLEALQLLQQADEENSKLRRSQVVQRGLEIPNPEELIPDTNLSALEKEISAELLSLVRSDFAQFKDPLSSYKIVDDIDEETYSKVKKYIANEIKSSGDSKNELTEQKQLPKSEQAINTALDLILENSKKAEEHELSYNQSWEEYYENLGDYIQEIHRRYEQLAEKDIEENLLATIAEQEKVAIGARSSRLHELVEEVTKAEQRVLRNL